MDPNVLLVVAGGTMLVLALLSAIVRRVYLSAVLLALTVGVALGPEALAVVDPIGAEGDHRRLLEELARLTLAVSLMAAGLQVTREDLRVNLGRTAMLLSVGMVGMWLATGLGAWLLLDLGVWTALLLGAIVTPTDPVVASALVTGTMAEENLPRRVRRTLIVESGANDGLALPFVLLCALMLTEPHADALSHWVVQAGKEIGIAVVAGAALGFACGKLAERAVRAREVEHVHLLGLGLSLSLFVLGAVRLAGGSGILGVFVAALAFSLVLEEQVREELEEVQESVTRFFVLPVFILFGAVLPWAAWADLGIVGLAFAGWVLVLRRPPVVPLALAPTRTDARSTSFLAWFGPVGVAAVYYATYVDRFHFAEQERVFAAATLAIVASILVHSVTATPGARLFAGRSPLTPLRHPLRPGVEGEP